MKIITILEKHDGLLGEVGRFFIYILISFLSLQVMAGPKKVKYLVVDGNSSVEQAQIILLGEQHYTSNYLSNQAFINKFGNDGDIVLIETLESGEETQKTDTYFTNFITKNVNVFGWDDENLFEIGRKHALAQIIARARQDKQSEMTASVGVSQQVYGRNQKLIETVGTFINSTTKKIWVLGGYAHFTKNPQLLKLLKSHQFISLIPEKSPPHTAYVFRLVDALPDFQIQILGRFSSQISYCSRALGEALKNSKIAWAR
jgi:hypothetical protein